MGRKKNAPSNRLTPLALRKGTKKSRPADTPAKLPAKPEKVYGDERCICVNGECKLRASGCRGFMGCPGFKGT